MLESTYMACLQYELSARKLRFVGQRTLPLIYKIVLDASDRDQMKGPSLDELGHAARVLRRLCVL